MQAKIHMKPRYLILGYNGEGVWHPQKILLKRESLYILQGLPIIPHSHLVKKLHIKTDNFVFTAICCSTHWPPKNDHILIVGFLKMTTFWKPNSQYYNKWWNCFIFHKTCEQRTQQRHEWISSLLLFTTLILSSIWFVLFKMLKQTDKIYISLNSTILQSFW